jgi:hypothetical protein
MGGAKSKYIATSELYAATDSGKAPPVVDARRAGFRCRFPAHYISAWHRDRRTSQPVIGDFALRPNEVNPMLQTLRANGIEVTALYQHMRHGVLPLFLMHLWANDDAVQLKASRAALDRSNVAHS